MQSRVSRLNTSNCTLQGMDRDKLLAAAFSGASADKIRNCVRMTAKSGDLERARPLIGQALAIAPKDPSVLNEAVEVYTLVGEQQKALDCLKNEVQGGYPRFELEANPELASLRNDSRYREIMAEAKTPR
jgi:uncharacterized protein HemY